MTAGDRSFPPVLARTWHAAWMQTTGTALLAAERRCIVRLRAPAQDSRSAHGLLYLIAVRDWTAGASKNTVKSVLTSDYQLGNWLVMLCRLQYLQLRDYLPCP